MRKDKRNILILAITLIVVAYISYFSFETGIIKKIKGSVTNLSQDNELVSNYPVITLVINSSGQKYVNSDVTIIVNAESLYNITNVQYSYDLSKWYNVKETSGKKIVTKINFNKTMNKKLYIRVQNEKGFYSYAYKTYVKIDKEKPKIRIKNDNTVFASDNVGIKYIQYSLDKLNWFNEEVSSSSISFTNKKYKYVRIVDETGNISEIKAIN